MSTILDHVLTSVKSSLKGAGPWTAKCPAHGGDRADSLSIAQGHKCVLLHCWAGCSLDAVCRAMGMRVRDLFSEQARPSPGEIRPRQRSYEQHQAAIAMWRRARSAAGNPYLQRKGVNAVDTLRQIRIRGEWHLLVPYKHGSICTGAEVISPAGRKSHLKGSQKSGAYWAPAPLSGRVLIAEGVATALTVREATGLSVAAVGGCQNFKSAGAFIILLPSVREIVLLPDAGAEEVARSTGFDWLGLPEGSPLGADWNDLGVSPTLRGLSRFI